MEEEIEDFCEEYWKGSGAGLHWVFPEGYPVIHA